MAASSLDLRKRVLRAWDSGSRRAAIATTFDVSLARVYRLVQRRRETGLITPLCHGCTNGKRRITDIPFTGRKL
ncbi:MAG: helix-turn-helix domain-containing protein [Vicinamibacterales bacterium]|nr:helix-turn-helix domain-containing protein [Vicinamibacterales bacterium]